MTISFEKITTYKTTKNNKKTIISCKKKTTLTTKTNENGENDDKTTITTKKRRKRLFLTKRLSSFRRCPQHGSDHTRTRFPGNRSQDLGKQ